MGPNRIFNLKGTCFACSECNKIVSCSISGCAATSHNTPGNACIAGNRNGGGGGGGGGPGTGWIGRIIAGGRLLLRLFGGGSSGVSFGDRGRFRLSSTIFSVGKGDWRGERWRDRCE